MATLVALIRRFAKQLASAGALSELHAPLAQDNNSG
jgi:hypothetical protein